MLIVVIHLDELQSVNTKGRKPYTSCTQTLINVTVIKHVQVLKLSIHSFSCPCDDSILIKQSSISYLFCETVKMLYNESFLVLKCFCNSLLPTQVFFYGFDMNYRIIPIEAMCRDLSIMAEYLLQMMCSERSFNTFTFQPTPMV